jgi:TP901 family phage tail tape measure protein
MQIRVTGTAHLEQMRAQFAAVTAQIELMNREMARTAMIPAGGNPKQYQQLARGINSVNRAWDSSIAASGAMRVQTMKMNDVIDKNTEKLRTQKLTMRETFGKKSKTMMNEIYQEQLRMRRAVVMTNEAMHGTGRHQVSMAVPTQTLKSWDTMNERLGMFRARMASASNAMVNWGKNTQWAGRQLTAGLTMPIVAFGAAAGYMAYQVDKELTRIAKVYDTTADATSKSVDDMAAVEKELMELRTAGIETAGKAAKAYGASVTDTLAVQAELAAAGQRGNQLQEATTEIMRIARLGEIDYQTATKASIALQTVFRMSTDELAESFNYMNAVENATSLATKDFAEAIPIAAAPIREFGGDIQELGVLLTAMKSRGIEAVQGANALKAAMQRLGRPSKQIQEEFKTITGADIQTLVDSSSSLTEVFQRLNAETKDLSAPERRDVFAGLFGSYQVTRMTALVDGVEDMTDATTQAGMAAKLAGQDSAVWADTARREMERWSESASGKLLIAFQSVKAGIAEMGPPFLEAASYALKFAGALIDMFNSMPKWAKRAAAIALIAGAIVGPLVMLVGLFANFIGSIGKMGAGLLRLITNFEILNKEQWATNLMQKLAAKGFIEEASAADILKTHLDAVALASRNVGAAIASIPGLPPSLVAALGTQGTKPPTPAANSRPGAQFLGMPGGMTQPVVAPAPSPLAWTATRASEQAMAQSRINTLMAEQRVIQAQQLLSL